MATSGFIAVDFTGRLVVDAYGSVLLFKTGADASTHTPHGGKVYRLVRAKMPRKKTVAEVYKEVGESKVVKDISTGVGEIPPYQPE